MIHTVLAQIVDKAFFDAIMSSAGVGAALGWAFTIWMYVQERAERKEAQQVIVSMLEKSITAAVNSVNGMNTLTSAVNAVISFVKGAPREQ